MKLLALLLVFLVNQCLATRLSYDLWWISGKTLSIKVKTSDGYSSDWQSFSGYSGGKKVCSSDGMWCLATQWGFENGGSVDQTIYFANTYRYSACYYVKDVDSPPFCLIGQPCPEVTHWECSSYADF